VLESFLRDFVSNYIIAVNSHKMHEFATLKTLWLSWEMACCNATDCLQGKSSVCLNTWEDVEQVCCICDVTALIFYLFPADISVLLPNQTGSM